MAVKILWNEFRCVELLYKGGIKSGSHWGLKLSQPMQYAIVVAYLVQWPGSNDEYSLFLACELLARL